MKRLLQIFEDDVGLLSFMRVSGFLVLSVILSMWILGNIRAGAYVPMGAYEAGIITAVIVGKAVQANIEYGGWSNGQNNPL